MAMSKEDQKAASDRIMAKLSPLHGMELESYRRLTTPVEEYPSGDRDYRVCQECGEEIKTLQGPKDSEGLSAFQQFSDHTTKHNPSPAQWAVAHQRIRQAMDIRKTADAQNAGR
jgi:hypothetical protein